MAITPTYPGVYIQEIPSPVRTIAGVATSVAAFIDFFTRGPINRPVQLLNMGDFEREFGGLNRQSEASYAIQQFFLNGGSEAWVVRVASGGIASAEAQIDSVIPPGAPPVLTVRAINQGTWGNSLRARIEPAPATNEFNLYVSEYGMQAGRLAPIRQEVFRNLSMDTARTNYVERVVNDANTGSKLVTVTKDAAAAAADVPVGNGTLSQPHAALPVIPAAASLDLTITSGATAVNGVAALPTINLAGLSLAEALPTIAAALQTALRAASPNPWFGSLVVDVVANRLRISVDTGSPAARATFAANLTSAALLLTGGTSTANIQEYVLGAGAIANSAQFAGAAGDDGVPPSSAALIGAPAAKTGIFALEEVDLFNILAIPRTANVGSLPNDLTATQAQAVMTAAINYCEMRRAFFVMDTPRGIDEPTEIRTWLAGNNTLRNRNAALYYPRVRIPDPLDEFRLRSVGASGSVIGLYARTDSNRGVWKAPAGTEATLRNVTELDDLLTDPENGTLNPLAINCLRTFPIYGNVCWGARTLDGSDQQASEWKYVPVRRFALFIEESLYRGTKWVVFEPNDEPLWSQIRLNVGAFMHNLFRQGAFQGTTPQQAYLVKCDKETTTQNDIDLGIVNIIVGFAPLKPAEFVIIKIQQLTGQVQT
jgi:phage tail sheath protein FI